LFGYGFARARFFAVKLPFLSYGQRALADVLATAAVHFGFHVEGDICVMRIHISQQGPTFLLL